MNKILNFLSFALLGFHFSCQSIAIPLGKMPIPMNDDIENQLYWAAYNTVENHLRDNIVKSLDRADEDHWHTEVLIDEVRSQIRQLKPSSPAEISHRFKFDGVDLKAMYFRNLMAEFMKRAASSDYFKGTIKPVMDLAYNKMRRIIQIQIIEMRLTHPNDLRTLFLKFYPAFKEYLDYESAKESRRDSVYQGHVSFEKLKTFRKSERRNVLRLIQNLELDEPEEFYFYWAFLLNKVTDTRIFLDSKSIPILLGDHALLDLDPLEGQKSAAILDGTPLSQLKFSDDLSISKVHFLATIQLLKLATILDDTNLIKQTVNLLSSRHGFKRMSLGQKFVHGACRASIKLWGKISKPIWTSVKK